MLGAALIFNKSQPTLKMYLKILYAVEFLLVLSVFVIKEIKHPVCETMIT